MKLHERTPLRDALLQRIGRSGKRGSYSGRGQKGQRSRSGHRIRPAERDIILKIPKMRGFRNKPKRDIPVVFNVGALATAFADQGKGGMEMNRATLRAAGLLKKDYKGIIKLLGAGEATFPMKVSGLEVSATAKIKIEKAGGSVAAA